MGRTGERDEHEPRLEEVGLESKKKTYQYQEADEKSRLRFLKKLEKIPEHLRVWADETGMDGNESYPYGWSPKGEPCAAVRPGNRNGRVSVIAGLREGKLVAPCWFTGYCNTRVVNAWLKEMLLPEAPIGAWLIWDNARFHQSKLTKRMIRKAGCNILFLPKYSPKDNLIEHQWFPVKNDARKILQTFQDLPTAIEVALLKRT